MNNDINEGTKKKKKTKRKKSSRRSTRNSAATNAPKVKRSQTYDEKRSGSFSARYSGAGAGAGAVVAPIRRNNTYDEQNNNNNNNNNNHASRDLSVSSPKKKKKDRLGQLQSSLRNNASVSRSSSPYKYLPASPTNNESDASVGASPTTAVSSRIAERMAWLAKSHASVSSSISMGSSWLGKDWEDIYNDIEDDNHNSDASLGGSLGGLTTTTPTSGDVNDKDDDDDLRYRKRESFQKRFNQSFFMMSGSLSPAQASTNENSDTSLKFLEQEPEEDEYDDDGQLRYTKRASFRERFNQSIQIMSLQGAGASSSRSLSLSPTRSRNENNSDMSLKFLEEEDEEGEDDDHMVYTKRESFQNQFNQSIHLLAALPKELQQKNQSLGWEKVSTIKLADGLKELPHTADLDTITDNATPKEQRKAQAADPIVQNRLVEVMVDDDAQQQTAIERRTIPGGCVFAEDVVERTWTDTNVVRQRLNDAAKIIQRFLRQSLWSIQQFNQEHRYLQEELEDTLKRHRNEIEEWRKFVEIEKQQIRILLEAENRHQDCHGIVELQVTFNSLQDAISQVKVENRSIEKETRLLEHQNDTLQLEEQNPKAILHRLEKEHQVEQLGKDIQDWEQLTEYYRDAIQRANTKIDSVTAQFKSTRKERRKISKTINGIVEMMTEYYTPVDSGGTQDDEHQQHAKLVKKITKWQTKRDKQLEQMKEARAQGLYNPQGGKGKDCPTKETTMTNSTTTTTSVTTQIIHTSGRLNDQPTGKASEVFLSGRENEFDVLYELGDKLGEGEFGAVYKCRHKGKQIDRAVTAMQNPEEEFIPGRLPPNRGQFTTQRVAKEEYFIPGRLAHRGQLTTHHNRKDDDGFVPGRLQVRLHHPNSTVAQHKEEDPMKLPFDRVAAYCNEEDDFFPARPNTSPNPKHAKTQNDSSRKQEVTESQGLPAVVSGKVQAITGEEKRPAHNFEDSQDSIVPASASTSREDFSQSSEDCLPHVEVQFIPGRLQPSLVHMTAQNDIHDEEFIPGRLTCMAQPTAQDAMHDDGFVPGRLQARHHQDPSSAAQQEDTDPGKLSYDQVAAYCNKEVVFLSGRQKDAFNRGHNVNVPAENQNSSIDKQAETASNPIFAVGAGENLAGIAGKTKSQTRNAVDPHNSTGIASLCSSGGELQRTSEDLQADLQEDFVPGSLLPTQGELTEQNDMHDEDFIPGRLAHRGQLTTQHDTHDNDFHPGRLRVRHHHPNSAAQQEEEDPGKLSYDRVAAYCSEEGDFLPGRPSGASNGEYTIAVPAEYQNNGVDMQAERVSHPAIAVGASQNQEIAVKARRQASDQTDLWDGIVAASAPTSGRDFNHSTEKLQCRIEEEFILGRLPSTQGQLTAENDMDEEFIPGRLATRDQQSTHHGVHDDCFIPNPLQVRLHNTSFTVEEEQEDPGRLQFDRVAAFCIQQDDFLPARSKNAFNRECNVEVPEFQPVEARKQEDTDSRALTAIGVSEDRDHKATGKEQRQTRDQVDPQDSMVGSSASTVTRGCHCSAEDYQFQKEGAGFIPGRIPPAKGQVATQNTMDDDGFMPNRIQFQYASANAQQEEDGLIPGKLPFDRVAAYCSEEDDFLLARRKKIPGVDHDKETHAEIQNNNPNMQNEAESRASIDVDVGEEHSILILPASPSRKECEMPPGHGESSWATSICNEVTGSSETQRATQIDDLKEHNETKSQLSNLIATAEEDEISLQDSTDELKVSMLPSGQLSAEEVKGKGSENDINDSYVDVAELEALDVSESMHVESLADLDGFDSFQNTSQLELMSENSKKKKKKRKKTKKSLSVNEESSFSFHFDSNDDIDTNDTNDGLIGMDDKQLKKLSAFDVSQSLEASLGKANEDSKYYDKDDMMNPGGNTRTGKSRKGKKKTKKQKKQDLDDSQDEEIAKILLSRSSRLSFEGSSMFEQILFSSSSKGTKNAADDTSSGSDTGSPTTSPKQTKGVGASKLKGAVSLVLGKQRQATAMMSLISRGLESDDDDDSDEEPVFESRGVVAEHRHSIVEGGDDKNRSLPKISKKIKKKKSAELREQQQSALFDLIVGRAA